MNAYTVPAALFVTSMAGLVLLLLGEGMWDIAGLVFLMFPVVAIARSWRRSRYQ